MMDGSLRRTERKTRFRASGRALVAEDSFAGVAEAPVRKGTESMMYSIRIPDLAIGVQCPSCDQSFWASGPTGYRDDQPICDACLLASCHPLGMLLALALVTRQLANLRMEKAGDYDAALREVGVFAQVYEQVAAKNGPPRRFELPKKYQTVAADDLPL